MDAGRRFAPWASNGNGQRGEDVKGAAAVAATHSDLSECAEELALLEELERITCRKLELARASGNVHS